MKIANYRHRSPGGCLLCKYINVSRDRGTLQKTASFIAILSNDFLIPPSFLRTQESYRDHYDLDKITAFYTQQQARRHAPWDRQFPHWHPAGIVLEAYTGNGAARGLLSLNKYRTIYDCWFLFFVSLKIIIPNPYDCAVIVLILPVPMGTLALPDYRSFRRKVFTVVSTTERCNDRKKHHVVAQSIDCSSHPA